jgi:Effector-associated domain 11/CHAT domain
MTNQELKTLVAQGRINQVLAKLQEQHPESNDLISLQKRQNQNERGYRLGSIEMSTYNTESARIASAILYFIDDPVDAPPPIRKDIHVTGGEGANITIVQNVSPIVGIAPSRKILFMAASPQDSCRLQVDKEYQIIDERLRASGERDAFDLLNPKFAMTIVNMKQAFFDNPTAEIVHFAGHGDIGGICIADDTNNTIQIPNSVLERHFKKYKDAVKVVILSCCYSATQAELLSNLGFYVVGTDEPVGDVSALEFTKGFYLGLCENTSIEDAFDTGLDILETNCQGTKTVVSLWKGGQKVR